MQNSCDITCQPPVEAAEQIHRLADAIQCQTVMVDGKQLRFRDADQDDTLIAVWISEQGMSVGASEVCTNLEQALAADQHFFEKGRPPNRPAL